MDSSIHSFALASRASDAAQCVGVLFREITERSPANTPNTLHHRLAGLGRYLADDLRATLDEHIKIKQPDTCALAAEMMGWLAAVCEAIVLSKETGLERGDGLKVQRLATTGAHITTDLWLAAVCEAILVSKESLEAADLNTPASQSDANAAVGGAR